MRDQMSGEYAGVSCTTAFNNFETAAKYRFTSSLLMGFLRTSQSAKSRFCRLECQ